MTCTFKLFCLAHRTLRDRRMHALRPKLAIEARSRPPQMHALAVTHNVSSLILSLNDVNHNTDRDLSL